jgi:hypothetical protein
VSKNPNLPLIHNRCPEDGRTERETMKTMIRDLDHKYKGLKHRIFTAVERGGLFEQREER